MKRFYALSLSILFVLSAAGQIKRVAVIGSSTSACFGFPSGINDGDCYINKFVNYYINLGWIIELRNLAVSGTNVYNGMPDGYPTIPFGGSVDPAHNITEAIGRGISPADVIIVNFPTNQYQNLNLHNILSFFSVIKKAANDDGKPCFITTAQPRDDFDAATRTKLKELRDSIMLQHGTFALDFWTTLANPDGTIVTAYARGDAIHLNAAGHDILYQRVQNANIFNATLPVKITGFSTKTIDKNIQLKWSVTDEMPGTSYKIQRSTDGLSFQNISEVQGRGTSSKQSYEYVDKAVVKGFYFYRLEINEPGNKSYSRVEKGFCENKLAMFAISAQGSNTNVRILSAERTTIQLRLINSTGVVLRTYIKNLEAGMNVFTLSHSALGRGVYWIESIQHNEKPFVQGFVAR
ncbi:MAG TPA: SGNH/GDSL hydrolase family protein [Chitinophagaceae bacterium]|nr:SGNH/GDSL hydrolase family protein [Chitinophagaceae bacterium]